MLAAVTVAPADAQRVVKQTHAADDKTPLSLFPLVTRWTLPLNNALTAPPAYDAARGFFPIEGGRLVAYDLVTGTELWMVSVPTEVQPTTGEGLVFVVEPNAIAALRAADGSVAWELPFADTLAVPLVWDNGWLVMATTAGDVLAFRGTDGQLIWRRALGTAAHARPALAGDRVYVPSGDGYVIALRVDTGEPVWNRRLGGPGNDILALDDRLFLGSKDNYFYCLDAGDGEVVWRWRTGADAIGVPVVDDRTVYFVALDNVLRALNRNSGVQRWQTGLPLRPTNGPLKADDTLVVSGMVPAVHGYKIRDGKTAGDFNAPAEVAAPLYAFAPPGLALPMVIAVTRDIVKGATVLALTRSFEPADSPVAPLPNPIPIGPPPPASTETRR